MAKPESKPKTELGRRLREVRRNLGDPDRDSFAAHLGVSKSTIAFYERGERTPDAAVLQSYRREFGIDINWLVTGEGDTFAGLANAPPTEQSVYLGGAEQRRDRNPRVRILGPVAADAWFVVQDGKEASVQVIPAADTRYPIAEQSAFVVLDDALNLRGIVEYNYVLSVPYWRYRHIFQIGDLVIVERWDEKKQRERSIRVVRRGENGSVSLETDSSNSKWQDSKITIPRGQFEVTGGATVKVTGLVVTTLQLFGPRE